MTVFCNKYSTEYALFFMLGEKKKKKSIQQIEINYPGKLSVADV